MSRSRSPALSALLLVLCVVWAPCPAVRAAADPTGQSLSAALSEPVATVGRAAQSALLTLTGQLDTRLQHLQTQQDDFQTRQDDFQTRQDDFRAQQDDFRAQQDVRLAELSGRLDVGLAELRGRLDAVQAAGSGAADRLPRDCSDVAGHSGVHLLRPGLEPSQPPVAALCDMETDGGGWTVFQRREDISPREDFFRGWAAYREGFGELDSEFWWGLRPLRALTAAMDRRYELRIDLEDFDGGRRHAIYQGFRISSEEDGYRLRAVNYTGDAGDSLEVHSGQRFSTVDRDQDSHNTYNCAQGHKGGWWYNKCHRSNLNGPYLAGQHDSLADGVNWKEWRGYHYSLKTVTMMIRPTKKFL